MPGLFSLIHFAICSFNDGTFYYDHILCLLAIAFTLKSDAIIHEQHISKPKKIEYEQVFEMRPSHDGGTQGKSPLPYYMDDEGDIANEFYEEINKKLVKISESKLKQI